MQAATMKWKHLGLFGLGAVMLLVAGCTGVRASAPESSPPMNSVAPATQACPVTPPTNDGVPIAITKQQYSSVYGHSNLWVGAWWTLPESLKQARSTDLADPKYPHRMKYPTWTVKAGEITDAGGRPRVIVKQLNGNGRGGSSVGGYASETLDNGTVARWWPTVVGVTAAGCWQITETVGDDNLVYVVKF